MNFEDLCLSPIKEIKNLNKFLGTKNGFFKNRRLKKLIKAPSTIGRYKNHNLNQFDSNDLEYVRKLGHLD